MYQNETVVVVGAGDSALQESMVLSRYCGKVRLVHRGSSFSGAAHFVDQVRTNEKVEVIWNATVDAILGSQMVEKVRLKHADGRTEEIPCAGVFAYIGLQPNAEFLPPEVERDAGGAVRTNETLETTTAGIYAIGAVRSGYEGTLADAMAEARRVSATIADRLNPR
jgi:thioredoxin reductase (NADPH)